VSRCQKWGESAMGMQSVGRGGHARIMDPNRTPPGLWVRCRTVLTQAVLHHAVFMETCMGPYQIAVPGGVARSTAEKC
jgi:hypothetical protein